jgi:hypothetical protein
VIEGDAGAPGSIPGPPAPLVGSPVLAYNQDGRAEIFVRASDGTIVHQWRTQPGGALNGTWVTFNGEFVGDPAVLAGSDLLMVLAAVDTSGKVEVWKQSANGPFSQLTSISGSFVPPAVLANGPSGTMVLAVRTANGDVATYAWSTNLGTFAPVSAAPLPRADSRPALGVDGTNVVAVVRSGTSLFEAAFAAGADAYPR